MLSGPVDDQHGDGSGGDTFADFGEMLVHGVNVDCWHDQCAADSTGRADGAKQIDPIETAVA